MKTLKYLLVTMLLLGVCSLTHSQKLSLGIFPEPQEVTISSQTYAPSHGYTLRGLNNPDADAVKLHQEAKRQNSGNATLGCLYADDH